MHAHRTTSGPVRVQALSHGAVGPIRPLRSPLTPAGSPSPTDIAAQDRHADDGSDADDVEEAELEDDDDEAAEEEDEDAAAQVAEEGDDDTVGVAMDADVVDAHGRVLNDGDELLDEPPPAARASGPARPSSSAAAASNAASVAAASSTPAAPALSHIDPFNPDGSHRLFLCPSSYGRPATVYFDYPLAFGIQRQQEKILCPRPCTLRYKHADDACIYNSVTGTLKRAGFVEQTDSSGRAGNQWNVRWGKHMMPEGFKELKGYQKINHFPGTGGIGRKDRLARNLGRSRRTHGADVYNFLPETYLLPADRVMWEMKFASEPPGTLWIAKPNSSSCGRGIRLVSRLSDIPAKRSCVVSRYVSPPLLVHGRKFDLRIYVLVTSFNPLKVYLYRNGLARFCTSKYDVSKKNLKKKYIHLTNFSVNKRSAHFVANQAQDGVGAGPDGDGGDDGGDGGGDGGGGDSSKWSLLAFQRWLRTQHAPADRCAQLWAEVSDIFIKTLLSVESNVCSNMSRLGARRDQAFEVYGFDILLDAQLKPWLMEVNCAPSLSSSSPLDKRIKNELLTDVFHTIGVKPAFVKEKGATMDGGKGDGEDEAGEDLPSQRKASGKHLALERVRGAHSASSTRTTTGSRPHSAASASSVTPTPTPTPPSRSPLLSGSSSPSPSPSPTASSSRASMGRSAGSGGVGGSVASGGGGGGGGGGGRIAKLKSVLPSSSSSGGGSGGSGGGAGRLAEFFNSLSSADLSLLREFMDERSRAESGSWRPIFPLPAGSCTNPDPLAPAHPAPAPAEASLDLYGPLFEFEKYDTALLMVFVKHFSREAQGKICRGERVGAGEVILLGNREERRTRLAATAAHGSATPSLSPHSSPSHSPTAAAASAASALGAHSDSNRNGLARAHCSDQSTSTRRRHSSSAGRGRKVASERGVDPSRGGGVETEADGEAESMQRQQRQDESLPHVMKELSLLGDEHIQRRFVHSHPSSHAASPTEVAAAITPGLSFSSSISSFASSSPPSSSSSLDPSHLREYFNIASGARMQPFESSQQQHPHLHRVPSRNSSATRKRTGSASALSPSAAAAAAARYAPEAHQFVVANAESSFGAGADGSARHGQDHRSRPSSTRRAGDRSAVQHAQLQAQQSVAAPTSSHLFQQQHSSPLNFTAARLAQLRRMQQAQARGEAIQAMAGHPPALHAGSAMQQPGGVRGVNSRPSHTGAVLGSSFPISGSSPARSPSASGRYRAGAGAAPTQGYVFGLTPPHAYGPMHAPDMPSSSIHSASLLHTHASPMGISAMPSRPMGSAGRRAQRPASGMHAYAHAQR